MPVELNAAIVAAWRASGIATPLFRKSSRGVSYAHQAPEYNGHRGVREICDICPAAAMRRRLRIQVLRIVMHGEAYAARPRFPPFHGRS